LDSAIAQSEVWSHELLSESDFTFWLIFGLSPKLELSESLSESEMTQWKSGLRKVCTIWTPRKLYKTNL